MDVLMILMIAALAALWRKVTLLQQRIDRLEQGARSAPAIEMPAVPLVDEGSPPAPSPVPVPFPVPAPVPAPPHPPAEAPARRREPARLVIGERPKPAAPRPAPAADTTTRPRERAGFEEIFGRRLPIWAGGITLAVAGVLIVRYSIQAGLLSPLVRIGLGLLFGGGLIAGAEAALRYAERVGDARVRQALAGAGIATLYGTTIAAANLYHLVGSTVAFAGLAAITALAAGLSLRFGAPSALLGLVGGLAAPALVGASQPDVPLLTLYLTLTVGGLCALGRQQRWWWLGAAALVGGFGWGTLLILGKAFDIADVLAVGLYTLALAIGLPLLLVGERARMVRLAGALVGCAQLAALVAVGGFAPLHWALFGLISVAIVWLSRRDPLFADMPAAGLAVAILLGLAWPNPDSTGLVLLLIGMAAIYGVPAALRVWRADTRRIDAPSIAAVAVAAGLLPLLTLSRSAAAVAALLGALLSAANAWRGWHHPQRRDDARFALLTMTTAALLQIAVMQALPQWTWAPAAALLALALIRLGVGAQDERIVRGGDAAALLTALLLLADPGLPRLVGVAQPVDLTTCVTWGVPTVVAALLGWLMAPRRTWLWPPAAVLIGYGAAAQVVPALWLPLVPVAITALLAATRRGVLIPAVYTAVVLMTAWAAVPVEHWVFAGVAALAGRFVAVQAWPPLLEATLRIGLPGLAILAAAALLPAETLPRRRMRRIGYAIAGAALMLAAHVAYKQLFALHTPADAFRYAMAERTVWQMLLAAAAVLAWRRHARLLAIACGGTAVAHFLWFTVVIANPLWVSQQVGVWLVPAYGVAGFLVWAAPRALPNTSRTRDLALMALITLGSFTLLRQTLPPLDTGTGEGEQIARSILALALAGLFLWIGIVRSLRDWRIASLALMLIAVVKVFLFDAAGLGGLARIVSFAALGFSLIGVGWLYSRYLPDDAH